MIISIQILNIQEDNNEKEISKNQKNFDFYNSEIISMENKEENDSIKNDVISNKVNFIFKRNNRKAKDNIRWFRISKSIDNKELMTKAEYENYDEFQQKTSNTISNSDKYGNYEIGDLHFKRSN